jgi:hypothetical protein
MVRCGDWREAPDLATGNGTRRHRALLLLLLAPALRRRCDIPAEIWSVPRGASGSWPHVHRPSVTSSFSSSAAVAARPRKSGSVLQRAPRSARVYVIGGPNRMSKRGGSTHQMSGLAAAGKEWSISSQQQQQQQQQQQWHRHTWTRVMVKRRGVRSLNGHRSQSQTPQNGQPNIY